MTRRQDAFARALTSLDLDIAVIHTADNLFYLSGIPLRTVALGSKPMWMVFGASGASALVGSKGEKVNNERNGFVKEVLAYGDEEKSLAGCGLPARSCAASPRTPDASGWSED